MRHLLAAAAILALATPLAAQESDAMTSQATQNADLTIERVFASPGLDGPSPRQAKLSPDGRYLTLLRNRADDRERYDLWGYDRQSGEWTMLVDSEALGSGRELSEDEKMQRERARVGNLKGIIAYQWNADGSGVLVPLDGDLYLAKLDGTVTRLTDTEESELNPKLSPEGEFVSFVRDRQLWVGPVGGDAQPITPKEGELIRWGEAEFVAQEEMGRMTGFWWNPDDTRLAVQRTDESPVGVVTRAAIGATGTKVFDQRYPVAGSDNAIVELFVMDPDGANRVKVDLGDDPTSTSPGSTEHPTAARSMSSARTASRRGSTCSGSIPQPGQARSGLPKKRRGPTTGSTCRTITASSTTGACCGGRNATAMGSSTASTVRTGSS